MHARVGGIRFKSKNGHMCLKFDRQEGNSEEVSSAVPIQNQFGFNIPPHYRQGTLGEEGNLKSASWYRSNPALSINGANGSVTFAVIFTRRMIALSKL